MTSKRRQNSKQKSPENPAPVKPAKTETPQASAKTPGKFTILAVCLLISFVFYGNTLSNGYSMDDELVTLDQKNVERGIAGIPAIFASHYSVNSKQNYEYRPVVLTSFAIEYQFFGRNPAASHFFNVLIYALTAFLIYFTLIKLFPHQHWSLPALTMFLFLIHPLHSEVVASLKNRDEMLALIFVLLSLRAFLNFADRGKLILVFLGLLYFVLALFSKKSCLPYLFLIPFTVMYLRNVKVWKGITFTLSMLVAAALLIVLVKVLVMTEKGQVDRATLFFENPLYEGKYGIGQRLLMALGTFGFYVKMFFVPYPLVAYYGYHTFDGFTFGIYHVMGLLGGIVLLWIMVRYFKTSKPMVLGAVLFIAGISMFVNLVVPAVGIVAERFTFEASLGFSLMLAVGLLTLFKAFQLDKPVQTSVIVLKVPQNLKVVAGVLTIATAVLVIPRNSDWNSQASLYRADIVKVPHSAKLNSLLGAYYAQKLQEIKRNPQAPNRMMYRTYADSCIYFFRQALAVYPDYASANNNLGTVYINYRYNLDSSLYYFKHAITVDSTYVEALGNYGAALESKADLETEKLAWVNHFSSTTGTPDEIENIMGKLEESDQPFALLDQMKTNLVQVFNMAVGGQNPEKTARGLDNITGTYPQQIIGKQQTAIDNAAFKQSLVMEYKKLRDLGRFDLAKKVTDSVTNVYFTPALCQMMGIDAQKGIPGTVKTRLEKKQQDYRLQSYQYYKKSLDLKADNMPLYTRLSAALIKWNMIDELIGIDALVLKAKTAREQVIELNTAKAYFIKKDFASGYAHTLKALDAIVKNITRLKKCMADFSTAGNQFALSYFAQAIRVNKETASRHVQGFNLVLRQEHMNAEADQLVQREKQINGY